ncbi:MAG: AsmA-like C-terminal region-containing protein [Verrucomicrobiia bacterium]
MPPLAQWRAALASRRVRVWAIWGGLLAFMAVSAVLVYLRWFGVPDFATEQIQEALRQRGIAVQFERLRLHGLTLEADRVRLAPLAPEAKWKAELRRATARFDRAPLRQGGLLPKTVRVEGGTFVWQPSPPTNAPVAQAVIESISAELRFPKRDLLELTRLDARFLQASIHATARITNASAVRSWAVRPRRREPPLGTRRLNELLSKLNELRLARDSRLDLQVQGDGRDPGSFHAHLGLRIPHAAWRDRALEGAVVEAGASPNPGEPGTLQFWLKGELNHGSAPGTLLQQASLAASGTASLAEREMRGTRWDLRIPRLDLPSVAFQQLIVGGSTAPQAGGAGQLASELAAEARVIEGALGGAQGAQLRAELRHGWSLVSPWDARWRLAIDRLVSTQGELSGIELSGDLRPGSPWAQWQPVDESWSAAFLSKAELFELDLHGEAQALNSSKLAAEAVSLSAAWRAPELRLEHLGARLYGGQLQASATLHAASRELVSDVRLDFDVHGIEPLLTPSARRWLGQFGWATPPVVTAQARLRLPEWTGGPPRWREEVMPSITLAGELAGNSASFRGVPVAYAKSHFTLSNLVWRLPDLFLQHGTGQARLDYQGHMGTREFHWRIDSTLDPHLLKPVLTEPGAQRGLDLFTFTQPPSFQGEVWGRWRDRQSVRFSGFVRATNFTFRGEHCDAASGTLWLTNSLLCFGDVAVNRGLEHITVASGAYDFTNRVVNLTNGLSTMDPDLVTRVIGPKVRAAIRPYHFPKPPTVRVNGRLPTVKTQSADVVFEVAGEAFDYWKLHPTRIRGDVLWKGDAVRITNLQANLSGGELRWNGNFDFTVRPGARFSFRGELRQADLHQLMLDLTKKTNNVHGFLDADFTITDANSRDERSWEGYGRARLRDGYLWDIPIFGFFSPVLNSVVPGLGNSPISAGDATFTIHRSTLHSSDLELMSPALRLGYTGSVDYQGNLDARMQAEILRDAWGVGKALSLALWPLSKAFEYKLTGTVSRPDTEPVYIPRFLLWPLSPFRSIQRLFNPPQPKPAPEPGTNIFN